MFSATPNAQPVPRAALYNPPPTSTSPSPELADQLHAHLARIYSQTPTTATTTTTTPTAAPPADPPPSEPPTYEFRLFSHQTTHPTQKITIRSPTPPPEGAVGGFLVPSRPRGYFFSDDDGTTTAGRKRREYEEASISGSEILRLSHLPSPGSALPWRVVTLHIAPHRRRSFQSTNSPPSLSLGPSETHRKRPGKKRRLAVRKAMAAREAMVRGREEKVREREVREREKRTRRNREKKVKRKRKGKGKEVKGGEVGVGQDGGDEGEGEGGK